MKKTILAKALTILIIASSVVALGADKSKHMGMELTTEQRQTMAATHEKMATCMRSDTPMDECRSDMMKSCTETMGKDGCHMMMGKMSHHKMSEDHQSTK